MSEFYELTSLACPMLGTLEVAKAAREWVAAPDATGTGALNCNRIACNGMQPARALTRSHCTRAVNAGRT